MLADNKKFAFRKLSQMFILMVFFTNNTWDTIKVQFRFLQMNLYLLFHCSFFSLFVPGWRPSVALTNGKFKRQMPC